MPRTPSTAPPTQKPEPAAVRAHLSRILESAAFRGSRRSSDFLRYVVEHTLDGHLDILKERSLGVAVFERTPDYDTNQDPIVRNTAGQVRRRLAQFYQEPSDEEYDVRIELPAGSYVPEILSRTIASAPPVVPVIPLSQEEPASPATEKAPAPGTSRFSTPVVLIGMLALVVLAGAVLYSSTRPASRGPVAQFWEPLLRQPGEVVVCVGQGHTYKFAPEWDQWFEEAALGGNVPPPPSPSVPLTAVTPVWDRYVGLTDAQTAGRILAMFGTLGKPVSLRGGRNTGLEDLRRKPLVLVGAINNDWTLKLTGELRFYFETVGNQVFVRDRQQDNRRDWSARTDIPFSKLPMDYAIVTRVFNRTTEQSVVVAAGNRGAGTEAAGEFLTSGTYLEQALRSAPANWQGKNVQFVLSARVFSGSPGPPTVIASHYW